MGLFMDPRSKPGDTRGSYARRRAPWLVVVAILCTAYILFKSDGAPNSTGWMALFVLWVAAILSVASADWSDLRRR